MTVRDLAKHSRFSTSRIEDIESGIETWFSATDRQLLAKALGVEPHVLEEVESRRPEAPEDLQPRAAAIEQAVLAGERQLSCPRCGNPLKCSVQEGLDMEEQPVRSAKAFCIKCPFVLR